MNGSTVLLVAITILWGVLPSSTQYTGTYYIMPNTSVASCPGNSCYNLQTYLLGVSAGIIFASNASVVFLPGTHILDTGSTAVFQDVVNLKLTGSDECSMMQQTVAQKVNEYGFDPYDEDEDITYVESSAIIACNGSRSGLAFINVRNLTIASITLRSCGGYSPTSLGNASVHLVNISNLMMDMVSIQNSTGYGLLGVNVVGQSQVLRSSFLGNNQFVKGMLNRTMFDGFHCNDDAMNTKYVFTNDGSLDYTTLAGGNVYFMYQDTLPSTSVTENQLSFLFCLFSLGVDGTFSAGIGNSKCWSDCPGTGLTIFSEQSTYKVDIVIIGATSYRNQAQFGANMYLKLCSTVSKVAVTNTSSRHALGEWSGLFMELIDIVPPLSDETAKTGLFINGSTFTCNFSPDSDSTINILLHKPNFNLTVLVANSSFDNSGLRIEAINTQTDVLLDSCSFEQSNLLLGTSHYGMNTHFADCNFNASSATIYGSNGSQSCSFWECSFINSDLFINGTNTLPNVTIMSSSFSDTDIFTIQFFALHLTLVIIDSDFESSYVFVSGYPLQSKAYIADCNFFISSMGASNSYIYFNGSVNFTNNFNNENGGAMALMSSTIVFEASSNVLFFNNSAANGGALCMDESSFLNLTSPSTVSFISNSALLFGGAIYVLSLPDFTPRIPNYDIPSCFIQLEDDGNMAKLYFDNNTAGEAGSILYGGNIDKCKRNYQFQNIFEIGSYNNNSSLISSEPKFVCLCKNVTNTPIVSTAFLLNPTSLRSAPCDTNITVTRTVYPGEKIELLFTTVGQANGTSPGIIVGYTTKGSGVEIILAVKSMTSCNSYNIPFKLINTTMYLTTQASLSDGTLNQQNFTVLVNVLSCPIGFALDTTLASCVCGTLLLRYNFSCDISTQIVTRAGSWVGPLLDSTLGLCLQCPYDYCKPEGIIKVTDFDSQCAYNRERVLCGQCKNGLSMTFGTSQCKTCHNYSILLVVPFALLGVLLVVLLFLLNLTVATGSLNGLIFYASIIRINESIFFPSNHSNVFTQFLSVFIAWLNLDFGIETCFYNGMDSYAKTCLQFVFPLYMYSLVGIIVLVGRCTSRLSGLRRSNAVSVLATLILLSYSKVLRIVITIFSYTRIDAQNATLSGAWLYDGNIEFLGSKHTPLFIVGLGVAILFNLPYIIILLFIPCLQSRSHWKSLHWVNHLKPFLDCYAAPYKDQYRFWFGILVWLRLLLYTMFAFDYNVNVRLLGVVVSVLFYTVALNRFFVYKKWTNMINETFFQMNLVVLSIARLIDINVSSAWSIVLVILIGSAFICFVAIITLHVYTDVRKGRGDDWKRLKAWLKRRMIIKDSIPLEQELDTDSSRNYNDLRESLLAE